MSQNPRLHLTIHEIAATQIIDGDPPETAMTAQRLRELGRDRHESLHMIMSTLTPQIWQAMSGRPYSPEQQLAALAALPGSWDRELARTRQRPRRPRGDDRRRRR